MASRSLKQRRWDKEMHGTVTPLLNTINHTPNQQLRVNLLEMSLPWGYTNFVMILCVYFPLRFSLIQCFRSRLANFFLFFPFFFTLEDYHSCWTFAWPHWQQNYTHILSIDTLTPMHTNNCVGKKLFNADIFFFKTSVLILHLN